MNATATGERSRNERRGAAGAKGAVEVNHLTRIIQTLRDCCTRKIIMRTYEVVTRSSTIITGNSI